MEEIGEKFSIIDNFSNPLEKLASKLIGSADKMTELGKTAENLSTKTDNLTSKTDELAEQASKDAQVWDEFDAKLRNTKMPTEQITAAKNDLKSFAEETQTSSEQLAFTYEKLSDAGVSSTGRLSKSLANLANTTKEPESALHDLTHIAAKMADEPKVKWQQFHSILKKTPEVAESIAASMDISMEDMINEINMGNIKTDKFLNTLNKLGQESAKIKPPEPPKPPVMPTEQINAAKADLKSFAEENSLANDKLMATYEKLSQSGLSSTGKLSKALASLAKDTEKPEESLNMLSNIAAEMADEPKVKWQQFHSILNKTPSVAESIAKSMDTSMEDMINDINKGTMSTDKFIRALHRAGDASGGIKPPRTPGGGGSEGGGRSSGGLGGSGGGITGLFGGGHHSGGAGFGTFLGANLATNAIMGGVNMAKNGILSLRQEMDEDNKAWQTFQGNMEQLHMPQGQINSTRASLTKFAQDSIYNSSDMASSYSQFAAVGTKNSLQLVKGFGGLAAAAKDPKQAMKTLSEQGTQMAAKPMIQWQDFKLMMEQSPAGISAVAKTMHESAGQLIKDVQSGKVKTQDFFDAVATTGTNKKFSAMATHYKTIGEALDGTKETLAQKIEPEWGTLSKVAIDAISNINNKIGGMNIKGLGNKLKPYLKSAIDWTIDTVTSATRDVKAFIGAFNDTGAVQDAIGIFNSVKTIIGKIFQPANGKNKDPLKPFRDMGDFAGGVVSGFSKLVKAISQLDPTSIQELAGAFLFLKFGMKGIVFSAAIWGLQQLSKMDPTTIKLVASSIVAVAVAFAAFKLISGISQFVVGIAQAKNALHDLFGVFKGGSMEKGISKSAGSFIKFGLGMLVFGAGVLAAGAGMWVMAQAAIDLANAGWPAIAVMGGMIVAIGLLATVVAIAGSAMIVGSVGFLIFGAAVLLVGAGVWLATEGTAALAGQLPNLANNGLAGAGALVVLGAALVVFSAFAVIAAIGVAVLGVGLVVLGAGALIAAVGVLALGVAGNVLAGALVGVGGGLMVAAAGIQAMKDAITGNFSGAKNVVNSVKDSVSGLKDTIGGIGKKAMNSDALSGMFGGISASADSTKNHVDKTKMTPNVDLSNVTGKMNGLGNQKFKGPQVSDPVMANGGNFFTNLENQSKNHSVPVQVKPQASNGNQDVMANLKSQIGNQQLPGMKMGKLQMNGSNQDVMSSLQSQMSNKPMTPPKVGTPKVPNPKMPKAGTIAAPKVTRPTVPQPKMPNHIGTIPAPKVHNPNMGPLVQAVQSGMQKAVNTVRSASSEMYSAGSYVGQGLASGIRSQIGNVASAANALISQADRAARAKAKIHSPSRLFAEIGDYLGQGMANGMNGTQDIISDASGNMNDAAQGNIDDLNVATNVQNRKSSTPSEFFGYGMSGNDNSSHYQNNSVNNQSSESNQSKHINIEKGAIQIINSGKGKSAEKILAEIEDLLVKQNEGGLANG